MRTLIALALLGLQDTALDAALKKANPGCAGTARVKADEAALSDPAIRDLSPLKGMRLTSIDLQGCKALTDLSPLRGMPLTSVTLYACRSLEDIAPLKDARLTRINFEGTRIRDLSPLKGQPVAWARICCPVLDLSPLAGMPLKHVDVGGGTGNDRNLSDLSPLKGMSEMIDLRFDQTSVADLSVVKDMKKLKFLAMFDTKVRDLGPLEGLALETLFFTPRDFPPEQIRIAREMKSLKHIDVSWKSWPNPPSAASFWARYDAGEFR